MAETITVGSTDAYLATPEMGAGPAVLVITEPDDAKRRQQVCDDFAAEGFTALAPALRNGQTAGDLAAAVDVLKPHPEVRGRGIGVVGYGAGAPLALWLAAHRSDDVVAVDVDSAEPLVDAQPQPDELAAAVQVHDDRDEDERLAWIRTLEFLRKHLG